MGSPSASRTNKRNKTNKPASAKDVDHTEPLTAPVKLVNFGEHDVNVASRVRVLPEPDLQSQQDEKRTETVLLEIDDQEKRVFEILNEVVQKMAQEELSIPERPEVRKIEVRIAGGWVRDKLLGLETHDIDIALDSCSGVEFARLVKTHMENSSRSAPSDDAVPSKIGIIAANPSQSKHLETATMRMVGLEVDFSNLRHEQYSSDSRIPTTVLGTALEDAFRRDFTINTLFFNLSSSRLEDWTHRGFVDLKQGLIATPLEAYQTFHDDPLRILRSIRFSCRYSMPLEEDIERCCLMPQLHHELHKKVSRERVGKELEGMLSGKSAHPKAALETILRLKLAGSVFDVPPAPLRGSIGIKSPQLYQGNPAHLAQLRECAWLETSACLNHLPGLVDGIHDKRTSLLANASANATTQVDERLLHLAVFCLPFFDLLYQQKRKTKSVVEYMMREGIKFSNKDCSSMISLIGSVQEAMALLESDPEVPKGAPEERLKAGLFVKRSSELWVTAMTLGTVALLQKYDVSWHPHWGKRMILWYTTIISMNLDECWRQPPLLNGKAIIDMLGLSRGPRVGFYTQKETEWRLMHPEGTQEDCLKFLKAVQKEQDKDEEQAMEHINKKMHM